MTFETAQLETDSNMCKVHQSDSFSHFCITCSGKICALCTQENATHYLHKTIDLDTLDSIKRTLSGSGQVEDCINKAKASFDAINKLVRKLNGTAKSRIKKLNKRVDKVLEQVEDIRHSCVTAILREAQTELAKTASSRERRTYAQHDIKRRVFKKRATDFLQQGIGNVKVLKELQESVPLHFLKVDDVNKSTLPEISRVEPISKDLIVSLKESVQQLQSKAKELFESAVGAQIMVLSLLCSNYALKVSFCDIVQNKWSTGQPLARERVHTAITTWDSKVIVAGGHSFLKVLSTVMKFDPLTNTWTSFPKLLTARCNHALVNLKGSLYAVGGYGGLFGKDDEPLSSAERFNTESNSWEPAFTLRTARAEFAAVALLIMKNLLVCTSGDPSTRSMIKTPVFDIEGNSWHDIDNFREQTYILRDFATITWNNTVVVAGGRIDDYVTDSVKQFDPLTGEWTTLPNLKIARAEPALVNVNGSLYVFGGYTKDDNDDVFGGKDDVTVERYDANKREWAYDGELCYERCSLCAASCEKGVVVSSACEDHTCELYDTKSSSSTIIASLNIGRWNHASATHDDTVYVFGGRYGTTSIEQYDANANSWTLLHVRLTSTFRGVAAVCVQDKIYILGSHNLDVKEESQDVEVLEFDPLKIVCASVTKRTIIGWSAGIAAINVTKDQWERILVSTKDSVNPN